MSTLHSPCEKSSLQLKPSLSAIVVTHSEPPALAAAVCGPSFGGSSLFARRTPRPGASLARTQQTRARNAREREAAAEEAGIARESSARMQLALQRVGSLKVQGVSHGSARGRKHAPRSRSGSFGVSASALREFAARTLARDPNLHGSLLFVPSFLKSLPAHTAQPDDFELVRLLGRVSFKRTESTATTVSWKARDKLSSETTAERARWL